MIPELRRQFNARFTPERYRSFLALLDQRAGTPMKFRVSETPCFLPQSLLDRLAATGVELLRQLIENVEYRKASEAAIPREFNVPNEAPRPLFAAVDFNLIRNAAGELEPRLIELQGFPSLYGFQTVFAQSYIDAYQLEPSLRFIADGADLERYHARLRTAIVANHDPANVVLLEIHPREQKTLPDFLVTERITGIRTVCITEVQREGKRLYYTHEGKRIPIHRIYNRAIVDEIVRKRVTLPFHFTDELNVEWAGHPNWFFRISKFSLPFLKHPCVPRTWFLAALSEWPGDLENYVLKPLYSFAGLGVIVGPSRADLESIPRERRRDYILQERMRFEPVIDTPHGPTEAEIRVLYIAREQMELPASEKRGQGVGDSGQGTKHMDRVREAALAFPSSLSPTPYPLASWHLGPLIARMGRGKMMGVDHNRDLEWVGASAGLIAG